MTITTDDPHGHDLDGVASTQHGLLRRDQALAFLGPRGLSRALRDGQLIRLARGVYRCAGSPGGFRQRAMAACLACGAPVAVSHRAAGVLWSFEAVAVPELLDVSVPPGRSGRLPGIRTHRAQLGDEVTLRAGIPVTSVRRTLSDLAGVVSSSVLARCVDDALRRRQATAADLIEWVEDGGRRRKAGSRMLRQLLADRGARGVGDGPGVAGVLSWMAEAGLPTPVCEHAVLAGGHQRFVDIAYPDSRIAIEYHGWEYHQMRSRMDDDHARTSELELSGWIVLVVTAAHGRAETIDRIRRARALRRGLAFIG